MSSVDWAQVAALFQDTIVVPNDNRAARYPADGSNISLTTARTSESLSIAGNGLTVVSKGNGVYTLTLVFGDSSTCAFASTEINTGDAWEVEFSDVQFTNAAQAGLTGPALYYSWRE